MNFPPPIAAHTAYLTEAVTVFLTSAVEIVRPLVPRYDPVLGTALAGKEEAFTGYTGPAGISRSSSAGAVMSGESYAEISTVRVVLPASATPLPRVEDQVIVTACPEDPALVNEVLRVIDVGYGGIANPTRVLTCTFATATPFNPNS